MQNVTTVEVKKIRPYVLAMIPFMALFAYELATMLPHRPSVPDLVHGYTIAMGGEGDSSKKAYVSAGDLILMLAPFFAAFAIGMTGFWRAGLFRQFLRR